MVKEMTFLHYLERPLKGNQILYLKLVNSIYSKVSLTQMTFRGFYETRTKTKSKNSVENFFEEIEILIFLMKCRGSSRADIKK